MKTLVHSPFPQFKTFIVVLKDILLRSDANRTGAAEDLSFYYLLPGSDAGSNGLEQGSATPAREVSAMIAMIGT